MEGGIHARRKGRGSARGRRLLPTFCRGVSERKAGRGGEDAPACDAKAGDVLRGWFGKSRGGGQTD